MSEFDRHAPGTFCWVELSTSDEAAAKRFYSALFGWTWNDIPMGEHGTYVMFQLGGRDVAAMYENKEGGPPPHWGSYVAVESADDAAAKVKSLGGNVLMEPFDVFDTGRMGVFQDRQGATISVWQAKNHIGVGLRDEIDALTWNELITNDVNSAIEFYTQLFGWTTKTDPGVPPYTEWLSGKTAIGGAIEMPGIPPNWLPYFSVTDCDKALETATANGGSVMMPPKEVPNVGRFALLRDPQGAAFYVIKLV